MKPTRIVQLAKPLATALALVCSATTGTASGLTPLPNDSRVRESLAYNIGTLAYIYGYPMVGMYREMHNKTHQVSAQRAESAPVNYFYHIDHLITPSKSADLLAPSPYMLYFGGWLNLTKEPVVLHNPNTGGRYYTMAITDLNLRLMHLGRRTVGTRAKNHALIGPGWKGALPSSVLPVHVDTNRLRVLGRLLVKNAGDLAEAKQLLAQFSASPMSSWRRGKKTQAEPALQRAAPLNPMSSLQFFEILNTLLRDNPQQGGEAALMAQFDTIGFGPLSEFRAEDIDEATAAGLNRAITEARKLIRYAARSVTAPVNGWTLSSQAGRYGYNYLQRAADITLGGSGSLPEESLYATSQFDNQIKRLNGAHRYTMTFAPGKLPPVKDFWTLTAYREEDSKLEQNAINRYGISSFDPGLKFAPDGSLTIYFQHSAPVKNKQNWLPVPAGNFFIKLRQYEPEDSLLNGEYRLPEVQRVGS